MKQATAALAFLTVLLAFSPGNLRAQQHGLGPVSLFITYRSKPLDRPAFLKYLETEGVSRLEQWKRDAVIDDYLLLANQYVDQDAWDALLILSFKEYLQTARWKEVEKTMPGGLSQDVLKIAWPSTTYLVDHTYHDATPGGPSDPRRAVFVVTSNSYDKVGGPPVFRNYADTYLIPQLKGWMEGDVLRGYDFYSHMFYPGRPMHVLMVLEYKDMESLARSPTVRAKTVAALRSKNAAWRALDDENIRATMRKEEGAVIARAVVSKPQ